MLTDVVRADRDGEISGGKDEYRQVRPEKTLCAGKNPESLSLISYLQTGAWQGRTCVGGWKRRAEGGWERGRPSEGRFEHCRDIKK